MSGRRAPRKSTKQGDTELRVATPTVRRHPSPSLLSKKILSFKFLEELEELKLNLESMVPSGMLVDVLDSFVVKIVEEEKNHSIPQPVVSFTHELIEVALGPIRRIIKDRSLHVDTDVEELVEEVKEGVFKVFKKHREGIKSTFTGPGQLRRPKILSFGDLEEDEEANKEVTKKKARMDVVFASE